MRTDAQRRAECRYRSRHKEILILRMRAYKAKNRDAILARRKAIRIKVRLGNPVKFLMHTVLTEKQMHLRKLAIARQKRYRMKKKGPALSILECMRSAIFRMKQRGYVKTQRSLKYLGCSVEFARAHIERQFRPGMSWDNHGKWHIDHIRPLALFDLTNPEHVAKASRWDNLQPLWASENLAKRHSVQS